MSRSRDLPMAAKFGTFGGVFTPCTLTILGVIMFLRYGQVVGQAGIMNAIIILFIAKIITVLTTLSLSAIATNTKVKGGGAYYIISRSLGVEFGGTIGVVFFLAQAISVAMYVIGFSEAFCSAFPGENGAQIFSMNFSQTEISTVTNIIIFICVFIGAGWTIKVQYFILGALLISLVSFFMGSLPSASMETFRANWGSGYISGDNFFTMFALFFPAVTGIMAGANMSGDLKDPGKSIPKGTFASIFFTLAIYFLMAVLLGCSVNRETLIHDNLIVKKIAWSSTLVTMGIFAATLSSALGSMMGAPRILQAFARDEIFTSLKIFGRGSGPNNEPRTATILTFAIAQICIMLGDLDVIAPIITMFFMITYGTLNLSTFYEAITQNPSYRPKFRFSHWSTALLGAVGCAVVMLLLAPTAAISSILVMAALYWFIKTRDIQAHWGDVQQGFAFERARQYLMRLEDDRYHPKNWRPIMLALSGGVWNRVTLSVYAHWLTAGHGLLTLAQIIVGDSENLIARRTSQEKRIRKFIVDNNISAFPAVVIQQNLEQGVISLVQCHGLGGFRPNTVLIGLNSDAERRESFEDMLRILHKLQMSIVLFRCEEEEYPWEAPEGTIDVWWRGKDNGSLMLLLAYLLVQNHEWANQRKSIRLIRMISATSGEQEALNHLKKLIENSRIIATPLVVVSDNVQQAIAETSRDCAVLFLGFRIDEQASFLESMENMTSGISRVFLVNSAGGMELEA